MANITEAEIRKIVENIIKGASASSAEYTSTEYNGRKLIGIYSDMNEAIKLEPHYAGFFINRAFMKYNMDDYFGAMADYDYALSLEPTNVIAYYNRALLKIEVNDKCNW